MQDNTARRMDTAQGPGDFPAPRTPKVRVEGGRAKVATEEGLLDLPVIPLPEKFADWIEQGRRSMYDKLLGKGAPGFFTSHLPVMTTWAKDKAFPMNCSNKGVGFLPRPQYLEELKDLFRSTIERTRGRPWRESMRERIAAVSSFYFDKEKVDLRALSTLEIFERGTYRNLDRTPLAALQYTGNAPDYVSFQVNCAVEVITPDDPRHEFVKLARVMFEYDSFHIAQTNFPYAYVLWISEVLDKTPFRVPEKAGKVITLPTKGGMPWDPRAVEAVNRAPGMIRQFITEAIEKYARDRGFTEITMEFVREAREVIERTAQGGEEPAGSGTPAAGEAGSPAPRASGCPFHGKAPGASAHAAPQAVPGPAGASAPVETPAAPGHAGLPAAAAPAVVPSSPAPMAAAAPEEPAALGPSRGAPPAAAAPTEPRAAARPAPSPGTGRDPSRPYGRIYVGLDSSAPADDAMALALAIGGKHGAEMVGSHVYAAKLHDNRFRAMEGGLPEQFRKEQELDRQRQIHDSLITKGLELITDSYLEGMSKACAEKGLRFTGVSLEGKNWKAMAEDIAAHGYDLVALGAHGVGRVGTSQLGTVAERLLRRVRTDVLLCRVPEEKNASDEIVVCLDGSTRSWAGLERALQLAKDHGKRVTAVSAFDPYFHYAMFKSLNKTLTEKARMVFKFEEQEKLHEDIIDSGLAKIYQSYLNIAKRVAAEKGVEIGIELLDGKPFQKILQRVRKSPPWLLVLGRIGFHSDEDMDIGGNTENLCRLAPCNLLVVDAQARPPAAFQAEETVSWTEEAKARLARIPAMAQGMAMQAIQNYVVAEGHTVVTESLLLEAVRSLLPPEVRKRMGVEDAAPAAPAADPAAAPSAGHDRIALAFKCQACGHVHHGSRPGKCPICGMGGHLFKLVEGARVEDGEVLATLGDRQLLWEKPALAALAAVPDEVARSRTRDRLEKRALTQRLRAVSLAMVEEALASEGLAVPPPAADGSATSATSATQGNVQDTQEGGGAAASRVMAWTAEALARLERVPEGFMRDSVRGAVEAHAAAAGLAEVDLATTEAGLAEARARMHASMGARSPGAPLPAGHPPVSPTPSENASQPGGNHGPA